MDFSLGFELLKDAQLFVANGSMPNEPAGPWYQAKSSLDAAKAKFAVMWHTVNFSEDDLKSIEGELAFAKDEFDRENRTLAEKNPCHR